MIYLLKDCYRDDSGKIIDILKIGYSSKPFKESRENHYKTTNYGFKFLMEREGDMELENYIHEKFHKFLLPGAREWFIYSQEIIDKFPTIQISDLVEDIDKNLLLYWLEKDLLKSIPNFYSLYKKHEKYIIEKLNYFTNDEKEVEIGLMFFSICLKNNIFFLRKLIIDSNLRESNFIHTLPETKIEVYLKLEGRSESSFRNEVLNLYKAKYLDFHSIEKKIKDNIDLRLKLTDKLLSGYEKMSEEEKLSWKNIIKDSKYVSNYSYINISPITNSVKFFDFLPIMESIAIEILRKEYIEEII